MTVALTVVSGLRHEGVGNDTFAYMQAYESSDIKEWRFLMDNFVDNYLSPTNNEAKDPGYKIFTKILYHFLPSGRLYLFVVALMYLIPFGFFIRKYSKNLPTTLFAYTFYLSLFWSYLPNSAIRQSITIGAVLLGYICLYNRKWILYIIVVLLGSLFHKSGLIVLGLLPLLYYVNAKIFFKYTIVLFFLSLMFIDHIALLFIDQSDIYNNYLGGEYYGGTNGGRPIMVILLFFGLFIIALMGLRKVDIKDDAQKLLLFGTSLSLIFLPLIWVNPSLIRIIGYFAPLMGIMVGESFDKINMGSFLRKIIITLFLYHSLSSFNSFKMMWQYMELHDRYGQKMETTMENQQLGNPYVIKNYIA
jgi:transmembrane protein EpsG